MRAVRMRTYPFLYVIHKNPNDEDALRPIGGAPFRRASLTAVFITQTMQLLVINPSGAVLTSGGASAFAGPGWTVRVADQVDSVERAIDSDAPAAVLLIQPPLSDHDEAERPRWRDITNRLSERRIATIVIQSADTPLRASGDDALIEFVPSTISAAELRGRFAMIARYHAHLRRMQLELQNMDELSGRLKEHFRLIDQEMQLAGRLQRDFLPKCDEPIGPARCATLYRPASWVSGDIYDVVRIDDGHTGVFVADAVGHGMAAGLLTMFIKRAISHSQSERSSALMLEPADVLAGLNDALAEQSLPNCQFVTACYGVLEHESLRFRCARGGHPAPIVLRHDGSMLEIDPDGGLLGLSRGERFETKDVQLAPGDKLLLYTDGLELAFQDGRASIDASAYKEVFRSLSGLSLTAMLAEIQRRLDTETGSLQPKDDVTILGLEIS